jgi:Mycothiol maleylpyruvate isomerase N-terminal domain
VSDLDRAALLDAVDAVYRNVTAVTGGLGEADLMRPSRCAGWAVADVLYHELLDARRALRTFASPADRPPDRDYVSYWTDYAPGGVADHAEESAAHARYVRIAAAAYPPGTLAWEWSETAAAACRAGRACAHPTVTTQGHVLTVTDFAATLAVEAAVHYLDLTVALPGAPAPEPASLALVRRVLARLLGAPLPAAWDDGTAALKGTGREPLTEADRQALGPSASKFPLFA